MIRRCHPFAVEELERRDVPAADFRTLPVLPLDNQAVLDNARAIAAHGAMLGRRQDTFLKVGDSNTASTNYLFPLGSASYNPVASGLATFGPDLVTTLYAFRGPLDAIGTNSYTRPSSTAFHGGYLPELVPHLQEELAATNAGIALVMVGTNDLGIYGDVNHFAGYLRSVIETMTKQGVLPVLSTIPDNIQQNGAYLNGVRVFNQAIANIAEQYNLPLWNLWRQLSTLTVSGLSSDGIHLNVSPNGGGSFVGIDVGYAQNARNLDALQILNWYRTQVITPPAAVAPSEWVPLAVDESVYAVGRDAGQGPVVDVFDTASGQRINRFLAFDPGFNGGVRVTVADVDGDRVPDVVTVPGVGGGPVVRVFSGKDGSLLASFFAFEPTFRGGLNVAAGDLDGDGMAEVVVGAGDGGAPVIAVFHGGDFAETSRFFAFESSFRGGVNVAVARDAIVAGAGLGGGPVVKWFDLAGKQQAAFFVFDANYRNGVTVAAGDLDGDGVDELAVAPAAGSPNVKVLDAQSGETRLSFYADDPSRQSGARLAIRGGMLLVGSGPGAPTSLTGFKGISAAPTALPLDSTSRGYGVFVG